jgi:DNA-binding FadR family transcriptional regulator
LDFHDAILTATDNDLVYEIGKSILELFKPSIAFGPEDPKISLLAFKTHKKVYKCIEKKDLLNINAVVRESLAHWEPDIPQKYRSAMNERN